MKQGLLLLVAVVIAACGGGGSRASSPPPPPPPPPANNAPQANDQAILTAPGQAFSGSLGATDADGDTLSFAVDQGPTSGSVVLSGAGDQDFEYTPNAGFVGNDSFTFTADDGTDTSNAGTVTVTVNGPPVATPANFTTSEIVDVAGTLAANDPEGDTLTYAIAMQPDKGTIEDLDVAAGTYVYRPDPAMDGADSFTFTAADAVQVSAPVSIDVEIFRWAGTRQFGGAGEDISTTGGLLLGLDGSMTYGGYTTDSLEGTPNLGDNDAWIQKVDRRGNVLWTRQFGDATMNGARNLLRHPSGDGFYVMVNGGDSATLYRFDDDGGQLWSEPVDFGALTLFAAAYWSNIDASGNVYALSWIDYATGGLGSAITKIDGANGSVIWTRELRTSLEDPIDPFIDDTQFIQARGIVFDSAGNVIVTGGFLADSGTVVRPCARCPFIASFDTDGNDRWLREPDAFTPCGAATDGQFFRSAIASDDTLYIAGIGGASLGDNSDGLVTRFSADGTNQDWAWCDINVESNSYLFSPPLFTSDGNLLVHYTLEGPVDPVSGERESADIVIVKLETDGTPIWSNVIEAQRADGTDASLGAGSIVEDAQGLYYLNGWLDGELTSAPNAGEDDAFLMRLDASGMQR